MYLRAILNREMALKDGRAEQGNCLSYALGNYFGRVLYIQLLVEERCTT